MLVRRAQMFTDVYLTHENCCMSFISDNCGWFFFWVFFTSLKQFEQKVEITEQMSLLSLLSEWSLQTKTHSR